MVKVNRDSRNKTRKKDIHDFYREVLQMPDLTDREIDQIRQNVIRLARAICEYVWGRKFY
jgi:hypothetical protein